MASPDNSPPARPASVPAEARWDPGKHPGFEWKLGALDEAGKKHGPYRSWTRDGVLHAETVYDHGEIHGTNKNFHPDGTVSSQAEWVRGVIMDSVYFRSDHPSTEPFAQAAPEVWSVRYYTRDGKTNYTIRYFARDGVECGPDGKPLPPRPDSVSPDARWFPDIDRWVDGEIERGTNLQVGRWRWWERGGVLRHEEQRDAAGEATMVADFRGDGTLQSKTTRDDDGEVRDSYFDDGALSIRRRKDSAGREVYKGSWFRDGSLDEERTRVYDGDALVSVTERGRGGALAFEARREGPATACMLYRSDGTLEASGAITDGKLTGTWRIFGEGGEVRREADLTALGLGHKITGDGLAWQLGRALFALDEATLPDLPALAGVDAEPWADTAGCYNDHVVEFPRLLRAVASPDPLVRRYALGAIDSETEHQGTIYPATARAMPYLVRLLAHPSVDRQRLLGVIQCAGELANNYVDQIGELPADHEDRIAIEGTANAIHAGWPTIFSLFGAATPAERRQILVIAKLAPEARPSLVAVARDDADPAMRACAVDSLTDATGYPEGDVLPCLHDRDLLVRVAAAIAIGCTKGPDSPRDVVTALAEGLRGWRDIAQRFAELPYTDGHVLSYIALALGSIRNGDARSLAQPLCAAIDEVDGRSAISYGQGLLALAFGRGELPFARRFVDILDTVARSKQFWVFNVNAHEVLARWDLPRDQQELVALVTELQAAGDPESVMHQRMHVGDQGDETEDDA